MEETQTANQVGRDAFAAWKDAIKNNIYSEDVDFQHTIQFYFPETFKQFNIELQNFAQVIVDHVEPLVAENNLAINLPRVDYYDGIGNRIDNVVHHPSYIESGNYIYGSQLLKKMTEPGGLLACLSLMFLSSQAGEAGHNCPIACSAGIIRVLQKVTDIPNRQFYLDKLTAPSFTENFTGAQFLTEIQGGSDVGLNATYAKQEGNVWRIYGEKWFCSNANADLIFLTARYDSNTLGTKGLGLFLIPAQWENNHNHYTIRRLKDKIGTRSMASGEIDFHGAYAIALPPVENGFHLVMDNVLHLSRLFNTFCVTGMARRAYSIARAYAKHRVAFGHPIANYPLVQENLSKIKAENAALIAGMFATVKMQDLYDADTQRGSDDEKKLLLRLLANMLKYLSALWSVEHIHHSLDVLAGNGAIESFSSIPRLLRDSIVCENWEGTHNVLRMQILKDIHRYQIDDIYLNYMRKEMSHLAEENTYKQPLLKILDQLSHTLETFKNLNQTQQALQIRLVVDRMAILFCGLMLLIEGIDQQKKGNQSKLNCFDYFWQLHFEDKITYDDQYLSLISKIMK